MALEYVRSLFVGVLQKLGFLNKECSILLLGLDNAGKTTLQFKLKTGHLQQFVPTLRAKEDEFAIGGVKFKSWDLGGHKAARHLWKKYHAIADGIVFMVDSADTDRLDEAKQELHGILEDPDIKHVPLVIMANKCDLKYAFGREALMKALGIDDSVQLFRTSVVQNMGYQEALRWLASKIP